MKTAFANKDDARAWVWRSLQERRAARFPFPVEGRIPDFTGTETAAGRLLDLPVLRNARIIKANPDSPQRLLREALLRRGVILYIPTPRLAGGFKRLDPARYHLYILGKPPACPPWTAGPNRSRFANYHR